MPRCNYRQSGPAEKPRYRYIPSDCKWCNPEHCQEYIDYIESQEHKKKGDQKAAFSHAWQKKHHIKKCPACGEDLTVFFSSTFPDLKFNQPPGLEKGGALK